MANKIKVYSCGGTAANILQNIEVLMANEQNKELFAGLDVSYVDTSTSNFRDNIDKLKTYIYAGTDGSAKERSKNNIIINNSAPDVLTKHKPSQLLNLIVHSAGGGSGAVAGQSLVKELHKMELPTIVLMVGNCDDMSQKRNTLDTLAAYQIISQQSKKVTVLYYTENERGDRTGSDKNIKEVVISLSILYNGLHAELDTQDLVAWVKNTSKFTQPGIATLSVERNPKTATYLDKIISIATLATPNTDTFVSDKLSYSTNGYIDQPVADIFRRNTTTDHVAVHYVIAIGTLNKKYIELQEIVQSDREYQNNYLQQTPFEISDDGDIVV